MIELSGICRTFVVGDSEVRALQDVDLKIPQGQYLSIMGPSGSGKSTLLNVIGLLDRPDAGAYLFEGVEIAGMDESERAKIRREKIGFVFQFFHLVPRLNAAQNVELPLVLAGVAQSERRDRVAEQLEAFGISDRAHHLPAQLSGGQSQRVAIARATVTQPRLVLADEPTGNLDRKTGLEVASILELLHQRGISVITVTHDPQLAARAERSIDMEDGRIVEVSK